jgi:hypothetical protein
MKATDCLKIIEYRIARVTYTTLRYNIVWVGFAEPSAFKKVHNVGLAGTFLVQAVLILLQSDSPP